MNTSFFSASNKESVPVRFPSINSSKNAILIHLADVQLEDIVEKKLSYCLQQKPLDQEILKKFFQPVEKAVIELYLEKNCRNQLKTAQILGINRNTLKKKILNYNLNWQDVLIREEKLAHLQNRVFVSSLSSLDLFSVSRIKLSLDNSEGKLPSFDVLAQLCGPVERKIIKVVLDCYRGNQIRASHFLGINRNTLKKKMNLKSKVKVF